MVPICQVGDVTDSGELLAPYRVLYFVNHTFRAHKVGEFGHNESSFAGPNVFDTHRGAGFEAPPAGQVGVGYSLGTHNRSAAWQVRAGNKFPQIFETGVRVFQQKTRGTNNFTEIVGRHVCSHSHRNTTGAIDKQMWNGGR